ncbi:MAG: hypothetical protein GY759_23270 [Chloroflexi bacterium]|nr:hypothetical protein [Chloroflexota bacterium]
MGSEQKSEDRFFWLALAGSRSMIGLLWLISLRWKLPPNFTPPPGMNGLMDWLELEVAHPTIALYADLVANIVIPNFMAFAWLVFLTELVVGLLLFTGTLTRVGALIGLLMALNLGIGLAEVPGEWPWSYLMLAMWHGLFLLTPPQKLLGIDRWLGSKLPAGRAGAILFGT